MFKSKGIRVLLIALLVAFLAMSTAYADGPIRFSKDQVCEMYVSENTSATLYQATAVSTSTGGSGGKGINPLYCRILGFSIGPSNSSAGSEFVVGLYDTATINGATAAADTIFDEAELDDTNDGKVPFWYPYPKKLATQLNIWQGINTIVVIYYEDTRDF